METIKYTLYLVFSFFASLNPFTALEKVVENAKSALENAKKELDKAEKENNLKSYKTALNKVENAKSALENANKALEKVEKPKINDLIQLAVFTCVLLNIDYTQKDIIDLGANTTGQFGYTKRIVYWMSFFGFALDCEKLKKELELFAKKELEKKAKTN